MDWVGVDTRRVGGGDGDYHHSADGDASRRLGQEVDAEFALWVRYAVVGDSLNVSLLEAIKFTFSTSCADSRSRLR